jgi:hypothetical protein
MELNDVAYPSLNAELASMSSIKRQNYFARRQLDISLVVEWQGQVDGHRIARRC